MGKPSRTLYYIYTQSITLYKYIGIVSIFLHICSATYTTKIPAVSEGGMCGRPTLTSPPLPIPPTYLACRMPMSVATRANLIDKREITTLRQPAAAAAVAATTTSDEQQKAAAAEKEQGWNCIDHCTTLNNYNNNNNNSGFLQHNGRSSITSVIKGETVVL